MQFSQFRLNKTKTFPHINCLACRLFFEERKRENLFSSRKLFQFFEFKRKKILVQWYRFHHAWSMFSPFTDSSKIFSSKYLGEQFRLLYNCSKFVLCIEAYSRLASCQNNFESPAKSEPKSNNHFHCYMKWKMYFSGHVFSMKKGKKYYILTSLTYILLH